MVVTLKEVAQRAGVSRSAVSRTFTPGASVSAKTRAKVEAAAKDLGYQPNALASSLTTGRTKLIGLVSDNFHNPFFLQIFDLFTRGLQDRGLRPLLVNLSGQTDPLGSVQMLQQYSVDGVVVASSTLPPEFSMAFLEAGLSVVNAFGRCGDDPMVHVVGIDDVASGAMAARELMDRGYRHVGFLGGPKGATSTRDRLRGFQETIADNHDMTLSTAFASNYTFDAGRAEMQRLLSGTRAQAYFCGDDVISIGALSAIADAGLSCPADIGLIGVNDMEMAGWQNINLTTLRQPIDQIVDSVIETMVQLTQNAGLDPEARVLECTLVERGTLRPKP